MTALRPLKGDGYRADPGQTFKTDNRNAERLEAAGLACRDRSPFANKMIPAVDNKALSPAPAPAVTITTKRTRRDLGTTVTR